MTALDTLNEARALWLRQDSQLSLEVDALEELPGVANGCSVYSPFAAEHPPADLTGPRTTGRASHHAHLPVDRAHGGPGRGPALTHTNGPARKPSRASASGAEGVSHEHR